jgi:hypothetical protein
LNRLRHATQRGTLSAANLGRERRRSDWRVEEAVSVDLR